jgi:hypothetical protein
LRGHSLSWHQAQAGKNGEPATCFCSWSDTLISNTEAAKQISDSMLEICRMIERSLDEVKESCSAEGASGDGHSKVAGGSGVRQRSGADGAR